MVRQDCIVRCRLPVKSSSTIDSNVCVCLSAGDATEQRGVSQVDLSESPGNENVDRAYCRRSLICLEVYAVVAIAPVIGVNAIRAYVHLSTLSCWRISLGNATNLRVKQLKVIGCTPRLCNVVPAR